MSWYALEFPKLCHNLNLGRCLDYMDTLRSMIKLESGARRKAVRASECLPSSTNTYWSSTQLGSQVSDFTTSDYKFIDTWSITYIHTCMHKRHPMWCTSSTIIIKLHVYVCIYEHRTPCGPRLPKQTRRGCENTCTVLPLSWYALESRLSSNEKDVHASLFQSSSL